jgi:hypothetical protein
MACHGVIVRRHGAIAGILSHSDSGADQQRITRVSLIALFSLHCGCNDIQTFPGALEEIGPGVPGQRNHGRVLPDSSILASR